MSSNYSAQQYNDAFRPHRLGNWEVPAKRDYERRPARDPPSLHDHTPFFLTDSGGRFLPEVREQIEELRRAHWMNHYYGQGPHPPLQPPPLLYSSWNSLWEAWFNGCNCLRKMNQGHGMEIEARRRQIPSFFREKKRRKKVERPAAAAPRVDPFLHYLRELQLPTIWVLGPPPQSIKGKRRNIAKALAQEFGFAHIELDEQVEKWGKRQDRVSGQGQPHQKQAQDHEGAEKGSVQEYSCLGIAIPSYRAQKPQKASPPPRRRQSEEETFNQNSSSELAEFGDPSINFNTGEKFTTEKILELLKFAMIEALPTAGFVLDGFPCNMEEAGEFERLFYPAALVLYFVGPRTPTPSVTTSNATTKGSSSKGDSSLRKEDMLAQPLRFRRKYQFTRKGGEVLCSGANYGRKVIRVLDTQDVDQDTSDFLFQVVRDNLDNYLDISSGRGGVTYDGDQEEDGGSGQGSLGVIGGLSVEVTPEPSPRKAPNKRDGEAFRRWAEEKERAVAISKGQLVRAKTIPPRLDSSSKALLEGGGGDYLSLYKTVALQQCSSSSQTTCSETETSTEESRGGGRGGSHKILNVSPASTSNPSSTTVLYKKDGWEQRASRDEDGHGTSSSSLGTTGQKHGSDPDERPLPIRFGFMDLFSSSDTLEVNGQTEGEVKVKVDANLNIKLKMPQSSQEGLEGGGGQKEGEEIMTIELLGRNWEESTEDLLTFGDNAIAGPKAPSPKKEKDNPWGELGEGDNIQ